MAIRLPLPWQEADSHSAAVAFWRSGGRRLMAIRPEGHQAIRPKGHQA